MTNKDPKDAEPLSPGWQARLEEVQRTQNDAYIASRSKNRIIHDECRSIIAYDPYEDGQSYSKRDMDAMGKKIESEISAALKAKGLVLMTDPDGNYSIEVKDG